MFSRDILIHQISELLHVRCRTNINALFFMAVKLSSMFVEALVDVQLYLMK